MKSLYGTLKRLLIPVVSSAAASVASTAAPHATGTTRDGSTAPVASETSIIALPVEGVWLVVVIATGTLIAATTAWKSNTNVINEKHENKIMTMLR